MIMIVLLVISRQKLAQLWLALLDQLLSVSVPMICKVAKTSTATNSVSYAEVNGNDTTNYTEIDIIFGNPDHYLSDKFIT